MLNSCRIKWYRFLEVAEEKSPWEAIKRTLTFCKNFVRMDRIMVPVYHDLSSLKLAVRNDETSSLEFLIVDSRNVHSVASMNQTMSRKWSGIDNVRSGYYSYAVVSNGEIIGDIWCATHRNVKFDPIHHDLSWLNIKCGDKDAYMFDMHVTPGSRGKIVTSYLLGNALNHLKESGFERVYGFYDKTNLPALWTHRLFRYTELGNRKVSRFLLYEKSEDVTSG